jgi:hypothetical protein
MHLLPVPLLGRCPAGTWFSSELLQTIHMISRDGNPEHLIHCLMPEGKREFRASMVASIILIQ